MSDAELRHIIAPRRYSPAALFGFWTAVFFLPGLLLLGIVQTVVRDHEGDLRHVSRGRLIQDIGRFSRELSPAAFIETQTAHLLAKLRSTPDHPRAAGPAVRLERIRSFWEARTGCQPFLTIVGGPDLASVAVAVSDDSRRRTGNGGSPFGTLRPPPVRIVSTWFRTMAGMDHRQSLGTPSSGAAASPKIAATLMNEFLGVSGDVIEHAPDKAVAVFSRRNFGETLYLLLHLDTISNRIDSAVSEGFILVIRERDIPPGLMLKSAAGVGRERGVSRRLVARRRCMATLIDTWKYAGKGLAIERAAPLSLYSPSFPPDPERMAVIRVEMSPRLLVSPFRVQERIVRAVIIFVWTAGALFLLRLAFTGTLGVMPLRSKLIILLAIAVGLPLLLFLLTATAYGRFSAILGRQERMNGLRQKLGQLESRVQSFASSAQHRVIGIRNRLAATLGSDEEAIRNVIGEFAGLRMYDSAYFIDSRGRSIHVPLSDHERRIGAFQMQKIARFFHPSVVNILKTRGNISPAIAEKLTSSMPPIPGGIALMQGLNPYHLNQFIINEGNMFDVDLPQLGNRHFQMFFPFRATADGNVSEDSILMLIGRPELVTSAAFDDYFRTSSYAREMDGEYETRVAVFQIDTAASRRLLDTAAWPATALSDPEITEFARRSFGNGWAGALARPGGKIEAARAFAGTPFFAVGIANPRGGILEGRLQIAFWFLAAYTLALLALAGHILGRLFAAPLDGLIAAVHRLRNGEFGLAVDIRSADEFEVIGTEISRMSRGVRERNRLRRFVSGLAADAAATDREAGSRVELTILFSHIRDFTGVSDGLGPSGTIALLNGCFTTLETAVAAHSGSIDKFIGDAMMAVFHPDRTGPGHASAACRAASAMRAAIDEFNRRRVSAGEPAVSIGVGIATGLVISGRVGSAIRRQDFTVIGDTVNLAARLSSLACTGTLGPILMSGMTASALGQDFGTRAAGSVHVKGKLEPVSVHELLDAERR